MALFERKRERENKNKRRVKGKIKMIFLWEITEEHKHVFWDGEMTFWSQRTPKMIFGRERYRKIGNEFLVRDRERAEMNH